METKNKIYALMLEGEGINIISLQYASSLEEAYILAKIEFEKENKKMIGLDNPLIGSKIGLFAIKSIDKLLETPKKETEIEVNTESDIKKIKEITKLINKEKNKEVKKTSKKNKKNELMKKMIETNDINVLKKNKKLFSSNEYKYLTSQIK